MTQENKAGVFDHGKLFNCSLIFVRNSKSLPIEYGQHLKILDLRRKLDRNKLANLFCLGVVVKEKRKTLKFRMMR